MASTSVPPWQLCCLEKLTHSRQYVDALVQHVGGFSLSMSIYRPYAHNACISPFQYGLVPRLAAIPLSFAPQQSLPETEKMCSFCSSLYSLCLRTLATRPRAAYNVSNSCTSVRYDRTGKACEFAQGRVCIVNLELPTPRHLTEHQLVDVGVARSPGFCCC